MSGTGTQMIRHAGSSVDLLIQAPSTSGPKRTFPQRDLRSPWFASCRNRRSSTAAFRPSTIYKRCDRGSTLIERRGRCVDYRCTRGVFRDDVRRIQYDHALCDENSMSMLRLYNNVPYSCTPQAEFLLFLKVFWILCVHYCVELAPLLQSWNDAHSHGGV